MAILELGSEAIDEILREQVVARLACHSRGETYLVPVSYAPEGAVKVEALLVHAFEGKKVRMMREDPRVCVEVEEIQDLAHWRTVVAQAVYEELTGAAARAALERVAQRLLPPPAAELARRGDDPFRPPGFAGNAVLFRLRLRSATGRAAR